MLNPDFKEFAELLASNQVEYLIVGGYALAAHGHPRYTGDLDFWLGTDPVNAKRTLVALGQFGFGGLHVSLDDLKANKRAAGRLQDLADLQALDGLQPGSD
jgi:hypothetical protein